MTRLILSAVAVLAALNLLAAMHDRTANASQDAKLTWRQHEIIVTRSKVHACQERLALRRSRVAQRVIVGGPAYRAWVLRLWRDRLGICTGLERRLSDPIQAILAVFGQYGWQAVAVARCETGGTFSINATNGQYLGLFQMGDYARSRYGHGYTPLAQARAAYRYFADAGYDWSPWECKP